MQNNIVGQTWKDEGFKYSKLALHTVAWQSIWTFKLHLILNMTFLSTEYNIIWWI